METGDGRDKEKEKKIERIGKVRQRKTKDHLKTTDNNGMSIKNCGQLGEVPPRQVRRPVRPNKIDRFGAVKEARIKTIPPPLIMYSGLF